MKGMSISAEISRSGHADPDERGMDPRQATRQNSLEEVSGAEDDLFFDLLEEMYSS